MIVPVTVIGSIAVVLCLSRAEPGCANASGATSKQVRVTITFFMMPPFFNEQISAPVWIEQEPHRVFATVQFHLAGSRLVFRPTARRSPSVHASPLENVPASGRVIGRNEGSCHA
jgi:hypothetical protein